MIPIRKVSGQKDPVIKLLRELRNETGRKRNGLFFVEGPEIVRRAIDFGAETQSMILTERFAASEEGEYLLDKAALAGIETYSSTSGLLAKILEAKPIPACLSLVERRVASLDNIFGGKCPLVLVVESGENADNLGMLLRSTDAAGVDGVILAANTVDPFNRRTVRGSRGAVFCVPICVVGEVNAAIRHAREHDLQVVAASANADKDYTEIDYTKPTMAIVGNEHTGISRAVKDESDVIVRIPMRGRIHSLNIAVSASILLFEAQRQRYQAQW